MGKVIKLSERQVLDPVFVNDLFDYVLTQTGKKEITIFQEVYGETEEAQKKLFYFLSHVDECPNRVIKHCLSLVKRQT